MSILTSRIAGRTSRIAGASEPEAMAAAAEDSPGRPVADDLAAVRRLALSRIDADEDTIRAVAGHLIGSGGKGLRAVLTLNAARLCGYGGDRHIGLAAAVEFMHAATLLHDDVVDESERRRGCDSARMIWGNKASILVGDYLLGQAFRLMVEAGSLSALDVLSRTAVTIAEGEVMQLAASGDVDLDEAHYLRIAAAKTAALFAAACRVGGAIAEAGEAAEEALERYGTELGMAFQIADDALDYVGDETATGKRVGDDFYEGKITLPIVLALRRAAPAEGDALRKAMRAPTRSPEDLAQAIGIFDGCGVIASMMERADAHVQRALCALERLPGGRHGDALAAAARFSGRRRR